MRKRAEWMTKADDSLLEALRDDGNLTPLAASREGMVARANIGRKYAGRRLRKLAEYGLVEYVDEGLYRLTDAGFSYLNEELDASTLTASAE
jgi:Mn-dependent DtxR family transcriptional regulator